MREHSRRPRAHTCRNLKLVLGWKRQDDAICHPRRAALVQHLGRGLEQHLGRGLERPFHHKMQRRPGLDIVVCERGPVLKLLARKDEVLLVGRDAHLVLDLALDLVNSV